MPSILTVTFNPAVDLSTHAPRVDPGHKVRCAAPRVHPGGGGINVARVVHRLGGAVTALFLAGGPAGAQLDRLLEQEQLPRARVPIAGETRQNLSVWEDTGGREYRFVLPGPTVTVQEWEGAFAQTLAAAQGHAFVVASGGLPPGAPVDGYARLARELRQRRIPLVVDTSGAPLAAALEAGVHLVKPSLRELRELTGEALADLASQARACRSLVQRGQAQAVALSLGSEGALLVSADQAWHAPALAVQVASTIGAGDSFLAGLVLSLARRAPLQEGLRLAMAASAAALLRPGTALCDPQEVARLLPTVRVAAFA